MMCAFQYLRFAGCLFASALLVGAATNIETRSCPIGTPTAQSYTWDFPREAQTLLGDIVAEAHTARTHADALHEFMLDPHTDWQVQALELDKIRTAVNDMGTKLCRLETIRRVVSPWERKAISGAAPLITELANDAESAITYLNTSRTYLFNPKYTGYGEDLYQRSTKLANSLGEMEKFGKIHEEDMRLEKSLGLIKRS